MEPIQSKQNQDDQVQVTMFDGSHKAHTFSFYNPVCIETSDTKIKVHIETLQCKELEKLGNNLPIWKFLS